MVIREDSQKASVLVVVACAVFLLSWGLYIQPVISVDAGQVIASLLFWGSFYGATRFFRAPGESDSPRPWWKVTDSPVVAGVWCTVIALNAISHFFTEDASVPVLIIKAVCIATLVGNILVLKSSKKVEH